MQHDVVIVGGAFAGLAAATYLGRARRRVLVIDAGKPRNRDAEEAHGYLGYDGRPPLTILDAAHRPIAAYPGVRLVEGKALAAAFANAYNNLVVAMRDYRPQQVRGGLGKGGTLKVGD